MTNNRYFFVKHIVLFLFFFQPSLKAENVQGELSHGVVVFKGIASLENIPISQFSAWSFQGSSWKSVPIQIDERTSRGDYVLEEGLPFTAKGGNQVVDPRDDFSFFRKDLGSCRPGQRKEKELNQNNVKNIWRFSVPSFDGHGPSQERVQCLFLVNSNQSLDSLKRIQKPAVAFDSQNQVVSNEVYKYYFRPERVALLGRIVLKDQKKRNHSVEVTSWSRFRMILRVPWWFTSIEVTEDDIISEVESWRQGPIRTILAIGVKFKGYLRMFNMHMFSELVFYESSLTIPTVFEFPIDAQDFFSAGTGVFYEIDFVKNPSWKLAKTTLTAMRAVDSKSFISESLSLEEKGELSATFTGGGQEIDIQFSLGSKDLPLPVYVESAQKNNLQLRQSWPLLDTFKGDFGVFQDLSQAKKGEFKFRLDLSLGNKAEGLRASRSTNRFSASLDQITL